MTSLLADLRYGLRGIRANPGFCFLAILTLALGIGAGTTMFSVIKNVLLSPFPYKNPEEIAALAVYLASDESSFTTGQIHIIDGGFSV